MKSYQRYHVNFVNEERTCEPRSRTGRTALIGYQHSGAKPPRKCEMGMKNVLSDYSQSEIGRRRRPELKIRIAVSHTLADPRRTIVAM